MKRLISWLVLGLILFNNSVYALEDIQPGRDDLVPRSGSQDEAVRARLFARLTQEETNGRDLLSSGEPVQTSDRDLLVTALNAGKELPSPHGQANSAAPLRFVFPTESIQPVSAWRPALYPIPWALTPYDHFYVLRPILADEINWPNADYRYGGVFFEDVVHTGVDIPAPIGTPVIAAGSGRVTWAGYGLFSGKVDENDPYGLAIQIRHDFGFQGHPLYTVYAHLSRVDVLPGQGIQAGEIIGLSGDTGKVTGPHLHFEVRIKEGDYFSTRNPELWMVPPQGWGVLAGRVMNTGGLNLHGQLVTVKALSKVNCPPCLSWKAYTYGGGYTYPDPYYHENVVIGDLPAGRYEIQINYLGRIYSLETDIWPGLVTFFTFRGRSGFTNEPPVLPGADFNP